jgi:hypothetical protein
MELPTTLGPDGSPVELRRATAADIPALVALLADDPLGVTREAADGDLSPYRRAFELIDADPAHVLLVAVAGDAVVGTLQLTVLPGMARRGALRADRGGAGGGRRAWRRRGGGDDRVGGR